MEISNRGILIIKNVFYTIRDSDSQFIPEGLLKLMTPTR